MASDGALDEGFAVEAAGGEGGDAVGDNLADEYYAGGSVIGGNAADIEAQVDFGVAARPGGDAVDAGIVKAEADEANPGIALPAVQGQAGGQQGAQGGGGYGPGQQEGAAPVGG